MGTNYYLHERPPCPTCERPYEELHIGKSSGGWVFALHVIPEDGINDLPDWEARWSKPGAEIRNEYREVISPEEMRKVIAGRVAGLQRSRVDGYHCIRHGAGTWDCIVGEFS